MKKVIATLVSIFFVSTIVAVSVAAASNDSDVVSLSNSSTNSFDINVDDNSIPADIEINKDVKEVPIKALNAVTKEDYFKKILNSVDYYNIVNGTIKTNMLNGSDFSIEYNVDMANCEAYQHVIGNDVDEEVFVQDGKIYTVDNAKNTRNYRLEVAYSKSDEDIDSDECDEMNFSSNEISVEDRVTYTTDGEMSSDASMIPVYHYRLNPTNIHYASTVSLFPQEIAFGFLSNKSLWEISEKTKFLGRECTILKGTTEKNYGSKLNVSRFNMVIDDESGIVLNFEGYDSDDNLTQYSTTTSVSFNKEEIKTFKLSEYQNYSAE
mgnify:CR=1 FL=1